jgi:hypothetical protein
MMSFILSEERAIYVVSQKVDTISHLLFGGQITFIINSIILLLIKYVLEKVLKIY